MKIMTFLKLKKTVFSIALGLLVFQTSCNKDDEQLEPQQENKIEESTTTDSELSKISSSFGASWHSVPSSDQTTGFSRGSSSNTVRETDHDGDLVRSFLVERETSSRLFLRQNPGTLRISLPIGDQGHIAYAQTFSSNRWVDWRRFRYNSYRCRGNADKTKPTITCRTSSIELVPGTSLPNLISRHVTATDDCQGSSVTVTQSPASGTSVRSGRQTITFTAKDRNGNTASCSMIVIGNTCAPSETVDPRINCGITGTRTLETGSRLPDYRRSFSATDNCTSVTLSQSPSSGSTVREGNQTITITARDQNGNSSRCRFTVKGERCSTNRPSLTAPNNFCFLSRHNVRASNTTADEYEWRVSGNGHIGRFQNGQLAFVRSGVTYKTSSNNVDIYTGNGRTNYNNTLAINPRTNQVTIWVRAKNDDCTWSGWRIVYKNAVRNCL